MTTYSQNVEEGKFYPREQTGRPLPETIQNQPRHEGTAYQQQQTGTLESTDTQPRHGETAYQQQKPGTVESTESQHRHEAAAYYKKQSGMTPRLVFFWCTYTCEEIIISV